MIQVLQSRFNHIPPCENHIVIPEISSVHLTFTWAKYRCPLWAHSEPDLGYK